MCLLLTFFNLWNHKNTLFWHNICTSHTFKTYSKCRILHVIIKSIQEGGGACPQTPLADSSSFVTLAANTGLDIFFQG
jgi:hypothetical protein